MKIGTAPEFGRSRFHLYCRFKSRCSSELEAVFERSCLVEHEMFRSGIRVLEEVAHALELYRDSAVVLKQGRLGISFRNYERIWVQIALVVPVPPESEPISASVNSLSYRRSSTSLAWPTDTQWIVPFTERHSPAPGFDVGSYVH